MSDTLRPDAAATKKTVFFVMFSSVALCIGSYGFSLRRRSAVGRSQDGTKDLSGGRLLKMPLIKAVRAGDVETVVPLLNPR